MWLPFSTTAWIHFQFSFSVAVQSHYKTMKGYELESTPTKDIKSPYTCTNIDINTYDKHKLTKSLLTNPLALSQMHFLCKSLNSHSGLAMTQLWGCSVCEALYSTVENSIIYRAAHHQLRLSLPTFSLGFNLSPYKLNCCIFFAWISSIFQIPWQIWSRRTLWINKR